jgi:hypothetical protein
MCLLYKAAPLANDKITLTLGEPRCIAIVVIVAVRVEDLLDDLMRIDCVSTLERNLSTRSGGEVLLKVLTARHADLIIRST